MAKVAFDTLNLARQLRDRAGFSAAQAEGTAEALAASFSDELATRSDLRSELAELKADLTRLVLTVATGQVALLLAAMFALAGLRR